MRRISILPALLVALCITAAVAVAARQTATATFESLSASGITGQADLKAMPTGETQIHASLRGLTPGVEYVVSLFPDNQTCTSGSVSEQFVRVTANAAGNANVIGKASRPIEQIGSLSVQLASDLSVQACAAVAP